MARKRLIFHIGLPKTGSSALQNYLSLNADSLKAAGIDYPYREPAASIAAGNNSGNLVQVLHKSGYLQKYSASHRPSGSMVLDTINHFAEDIFGEIRSIVLSSNEDTVIFTSESISSINARSLSHLSRAFSAFDLTIVSFVRDLFDHSLSGWQQAVKMQGVLYEKDFATFLADRRYRPPGITALQRFLRADLPVLVLNYDTFRNDVAGAFLNAARLPTPAPEIRLEGQRYNTSLTVSEAVVAARVASILRNQAFAKTVVSMLLARPDRPPRQNYYSRELHAQLLEANRGALDVINLVIVGDRLSTNLRDRPSDEMLVHPLDLDVMLRALRLASGMKDTQVAWKPASPQRHRPIVRGRGDVPPDFDPEAYLFLNPDVAKAGVDPRQHYIDHGRGELRRYSYS